MRSLRWIGCLSLLLGGLEDAHRAKILVQNSL